jgi:hypothetical protein
MSDEDYGDGGESTQRSAPPANLDKFESRLDSITAAITGMQREGVQRDERNKILAQEATVASKVRQSQSAVDAAERALAAAHDDGDSVTIARAQRTLTERVAERERASNVHMQFKSAIEEGDRRTGGSSGAAGQNPTQQQEMDTKNLNSWKNKHSAWYGVDNDMTKAAHEVDQRIRGAGVITVGTPEYFKAIDRQMAQKFPTRFSGAPETAGGSGSSGNNGGSSRPNVGRIPGQVLDAWARMGIDTSDNKVLERMVKNRERLADKGILPGEPAYGTVLTR